MPAQSKKSSLAARLGDKARKAFNECKDKPPEFDSNARLPAGIEGGVAKLVECKFTQIAAGKANVGKDMFYAAGVVVSPDEVNGVSLVGLRTQISEPLYDTPTRSRKTIEDHLEWVMNEMKKLGLDMSEFSPDDLEDMAATLKEQQPHFRFRTWSGSKQEIEQRGGKFFVGTKGPYATEAALKVVNPFAGREPMVNHTWNGSCEWVEEDDTSAAMEDATGEVAEPPKKAGKAVTVAPEPEESGDVDPATLAEQADGGDQEAAEELSKLALAAGVDEDSISGAENWAAVVEMMADDDEKESPVEDDPFKPEKGEVYQYKAPGKKKAVDCEVTAVFETRETVNLKNLTDSTVYKAVPWAKLEQ